MQTNETSGINIEGHIKIYDPDSNEIFVNKRCDGIPTTNSTTDLIDTNTEYRYDRRKTNKN